MTPKPDYRVTFWRQPYVEPGELSEGVGQEGVMEITGARDVVEVLDWATGEAKGQRRQLHPLRGR